MPDFTVGIGPDRPGPRVHEANTKLTKIHIFLRIFGNSQWFPVLIKEKSPISPWVYGIHCGLGLGFSYARITHKETYFRAEYVPTWTFGLCARRCGSYATPAQGRITHKYVIQDYVPARFKGGLRSKPPSHTRKRDTNLRLKERRERTQTNLGQAGE